MIVANQKLNTSDSSESESQNTSFGRPQQFTLNSHKLPTYANRHSIFASTIPPIDVNSLIKKDQMCHDIYEEDQMSIERTPMLKKTQSILVQSNEEALKGSLNKNKGRIFQIGLQKGFLLPCLSQYYVRSEQFKNKSDVHQDLEREGSLSNQDLILLMESSEQNEQKRMSEGNKDTLKQEKQSLAKLGKRQSLILFCLTVIVALGIIFVGRIV